MVHGGGRPAAGLGLGVHSCAPAVPLAGMGRVLSPEPSGALQATLASHGSRLPGDRRRILPSSSLNSWFPIYKALLAGPASGNTNHLCPPRARQGLRGAPTPVWSRCPLPPRSPPPTPRGRPAPGCQEGLSRGAAGARWPLWVAPQREGSTGPALPSPPGLGVHRPPPSGASACRRQGPDSLSTQRREPA